MRRSRAILARTRRSVKMHQRITPWSRGFEIHLIRRAAWRATRTRDGAIRIGTPRVLALVTSFFRDDDRPEIGHRFLCQLCQKLILRVGVIAYAVEKGVPDMRRT